MSTQEQPVQPDELDAVADDVFSPMEGFEMSPKWGKVIEALGKAQGAMNGGPKKTATNPHFRSQYADLHEVISTVRESLLKEGIVVTHGTRAIDHDGPTARLAVSTVLCHHKSEQWVRNTIVMDARDRGPQAVGAAITYGRRYNYLALVDLAPEDDDGNAASPAPRRTTQQPKRESAPSPPPPTDGDHSDLFEELKPSDVACVKFGKNAGTPVTELTDRQLSWYVKASHDELDSDDCKPGGKYERYVPEKIEWRDALEKEVERRGGVEG